MKNIKAIAFIDKKDKYSEYWFIRKDTFSLKPNYIDKKNGYKGINLSGTTSKTNLMLSSI
ncbi:MAG: hypothetical protein ACLS85_02050 [Coprobacillus cateniformis]